MKKISGLFLFQLILLLPLVSCASSGTSIDRILAEKNAPPGVVIEIVTGDRDGLAWALPLARDYIKSLRKRFPGLTVAIVTHGREQFALQKTKNKSKKKIHSLTQTLKKEDVPVHLCGTFAGWEGLSDEDFPAYVDVAAAGPAQINDYLALDYKLIVINSRSKP
ncbi:MAG: DsrE family protein [Gammaproteobacteria bacterium]|nr:DsrE family protein [Gammaproteobacteria bacterium]